MVNVLITHNNMLEAQIVQQGTSSCAPLGRIRNKLETNPCKQCNYVTLKGAQRSLRVLSSRKVEMCLELSVRREMLNLRPYPLEGVVML